MATAQKEEETQMWLFLLFVAVPIIEIALFIQVGGFLGLWPTLAIVITTAMAGTFLMRTQGAAEMQSLQSSLSTGRNPMDPIANGAFIIVAGVLLLTPGFFTDAFGLALLIPPVRHAIIRLIAARIQNGANIHMSGFQKTTASETVVDGDYEVVDEEPTVKHNDSDWIR